MTGYASPDWGSRTDTEPHRPTQVTRVRSSCAHSTTRRLSAGVPRLGAARSSTDANWISLVADGSLDGHFSHSATSETRSALDISDSGVARRFAYARSRNSRGHPSGPCSRARRTSTPSRTPGCPQCRPDQVRRIFCYLINMRCGWYSAAYVPLIHGSRATSPPAPSDPGGGCLKTCPLRNFCAGDP